MKKYPALMAVFILAFISWKSNGVKNNMPPMQKGWVTLFDGKTTNGWHTYGKTGAGDAWEVTEGALHLDPTKDGRGDLVTNIEYSNFHLKLDWKVVPESNSGIIFLVHEDPAKYGQTYSTGLEMQVLDNVNASDNKKENHLAGTLYDLIGTAALSKPRPVGEWNKAEIICNHGKLVLILNGVKVVSTILWDDHWQKLMAGSKFAGWPGFGTFKTGHIALQDHGDEVWYRNITIRKL